MTRKKRIDRGHEEREPRRKSEVIDVIIGHDGDINNDLRAKCDHFEEQTILLFQTDKTNVSREIAIRKIKELKRILQQIEQRDTDDVIMERAHCLSLELEDLFKHREWERRQKRLSDFSDPRPPRSKSLGAHHRSMNTTPVAIFHHRNEEENDGDDEVFVTSTPVSLPEAVSSKRKFSTKSVYASTRSVLTTQIRCFRCQVVVRRFASANRDWDAKHFCKKCKKYRFLYYVFPCLS